MYRFVAEYSEISEGYEEDRYKEVGGKVEDLEDTGKEKNKVVTHMKAEQQKTNAFRGYN